MSHDNFEELFDLMDPEKLEKLYDHYVDEYKDTPDPETPELDADMERKFAELRKSEIRNIRKHKTRRIAVAALILFLIGGFTITQSSAWRINITNIKLALKNVQTEQDELSKWPDGKPFPAFIPETYNIDKVDNQYIRSQIKYTSPNLPEIIYEVYPKDSTIFDQSAEGSEPIKIGENNGYLITYHNSHDLIWSTSEHIFRLCGNEKETLIAMAKSVK